MTKKNEILFEKAKKVFYRFTEEEKEEQRYELAIYLLTELASDDIESIKRSINEVKKLTDLDVSVEEAINIRRIAAEKKEENKKNQQNDKPMLFDKESSVFYRFTEEQLDEQKHELAVYILRQIKEDDVYSVETGIDVVRRITGIEVSIEEALEIKRKAVGEKTGYSK